MTPDHLMTLTGTLTRVTQAGAVDDYGDPTEQTTTETVACWLYETPGSERTAEANWQERVAQVWLPAATDPTGLDRIAVNGTAWQFVAPPRVCFNARTGVASHVEGDVKATT